MAAIAPNAAASRIESEVNRVRALIEGRRFAEALAAAQQLEAEVPENRDVLYMIAVSQRYLGRIAEALRTLARLETLHPHYSRLFQERGHCHVAQREAEPAIAAFVQAVQLNPALPGSWKSLQTLFRIVGRSADAEMAGAQAAALAARPMDIVTASSLFADGEIYPAEVLARQYLRRDGNHPEAMGLLAKIAMAHGALDDAELLLEALLAQAPAAHAARYDYVRTLIARNTYAKALAELDKLLARRARQPRRTARPMRPPASGSARRARRRRSTASCSPGRRRRRNCICRSPMR